jgi:serine/threonine protein kinase
MVSSGMLVYIVSVGCLTVDSSAVHKPSGQKVAIKKITPFDHSMFCLRTLREMKLLRYFNHENIISILDIQKPRTLDTFNEVYLIQASFATKRSRTVTDRHRNSWRLICIVSFALKSCLMTIANTLSIKHCVRSRPCTLPMCFIVT